MDLVAGTPLWPEGRRLRAASGWSRGPQRVSVQCISASLCSWWPGVQEQSRAGDRPLLDRGARRGIVLLQVGSEAGVSSVGNLEEPRFGSCSVKGPPSQGPQRLSQLLW